ncbi:RNA-directed DNA polymerase [Ralstonia mojiangensis]|uniref:RNA-directed DNA polymerase n=1 Tax=Ralstonia mojiangensis TaxID=2953895 RepID=UPI00209142FB|nr:RNA-directed DNA polymerase [Ralstonia mojiangensis]MCO5414716.1 RNA-directed DNA polymerase [Ralstonia mojiangensis]
MITLSDLYLAYRKAKAEAFYENTHFHAVAFTKYEQELHENLVRLQEILKYDGGEWAEENQFIGDYAYLPKSVDTACWENAHDGHFRALDPYDDWLQRFVSSRNRMAPASLRLVMRPSVDLQIISALWIMQVGHLFDAVLDRNTSFGNRLRRTASRKNTSQKSEPVLNMNTPALFSPYFSAYQEWRERGLRTMEQALEQERSVLAVTMDIAKFYHRVSPEFILRPAFLKTIGVNLTVGQKRFTGHLLKAINTWYSGTPDYKDRPEGAIPVGLSASKIIANVLLAQFDRAVMEKVNPLYYGRYVDDLFLVLDAAEEDDGAISVGQRLSRILTPLLKVQNESNGPPSLRLNLPYAKDSDLVFTGNKQKIFSLSSRHGADLIHYIRAQIRAQSSEYRLLPAVPSTASEMASRALLATPNASLQVDALRKADVVSVRRLGFALLLSDIETYSLDLAPASWRGLREQFYALAQRHIVTPVGFFDYFSYIPRIFGLMLACDDFSAARELIDGLVKVSDLLKKTTTLGNKKNEKSFQLCLEQYCHALLEAGLAAASARDSVVNSSYLGVIRRLKKISADVVLPGSVETLRRLVKQVLLADWGRRPYKDYWIAEQDRDEPGPPVPAQWAIRRQIRLGAIRKFRKQVSSLKTPFWPALAFPTRPLRADEIPLISPQVLKEPDLFREAIGFLRGAKVGSGDELGFRLPPPGSGVSTFVVPRRKREIIRIAVTSRETTHEQWVSAAKNRHDQSIQRYEEFNDLVNRILRENKRPDYIVMPELSVPLRWALRAARKLASNGVSLLTGVEYYRDKVAKKLRNDCLVSLTTRWPGYSSNIVVLQPKFVPAHAERKELSRILGMKNALFEPTGVHSIPTVFQHGDFFFSILVCSDLTNINHRNSLRGEIDALFALEWNQDTKTFSSLVEATASDLHAYVVQANNRLYGDSRIRSPATKDYARDVVQVKGGISDYYVLGSIEHRALRKAQRRRSGGALFKPVPIGYRMSLARRKASG